jgi:uncharacterized phage protein (TIGR01671 family)
VRLFKFRAWRKNKCSDGSMDYSMSWVSLSEFFDHLEKYYPEAIIMQYTGLEDHNNVSIYEGDTVRYKQRNIETAFGMTKGEDWIEKTRKIKYSGQSFNVPQGFIKDLEVIGNIYENNK